MRFDKELFGKELEAILDKHKTANRISWTSIKSFTLEARTYSDGLFGTRSLEVLPLFNKEKNIYKMTIYVNPTPEKYGTMVDYHFNIPALNTE